MKGLHSMIIDMLFLSRRKAAFPFLKERDAWWTVLVIDMIAIPLTSFTHKVCKNKLLPDHFTIFSLLTFIAGILTLYVFQSAPIASVLFFLSTVFDCVDGKLARISETKSSYGAILDSSIDLIIHGPGFIAIGFWIYKISSITVLIAICLYSFYITYVHVKSIHYHLNNIKYNDSIAHQNHLPFLNDFTKKLGLNIYPISHVEMCFFVIPILLINLRKYHLEVFIVFLFLVFSFQYFMPLYDKYIYFSNQAKRKHQG